MNDDDVIDKAKKRYEYAKSAWATIYDKAKEDLHFLSDEPFAQWDEQEAYTRNQVGRPALQIDQLGQFVRQVVNDIRMNTPTIKVIPVGDGADIETSEMMQGRIRSIEYKSNADSAYDTASDFSVKSSIGFITVDHDYCDDGGFEQELKINRVINPFAILLDPDSIQADGSDAKWGFIFEQITRSEFENLYPDAALQGFSDEKPRNDEKDDSIQIARYYTIEEESKKVGLLPDGRIEEIKDGVAYKITRTIKKSKVKCYKLSAKDILEETTFPGRYIPIVPVYGEEAWIDGERNIYSLIRRSKQAQYMYNLWKSLETELLLKQQQAPVQAAVGQMRDFEVDWKNPEKAMVLYYHQTDVDGNPAPAPQRLQPPTIPTGVVNASQGAENDIRKTLGMYNAQVGKREGSISGIALEQLDRSGDVATYHFGDNLVRSITHVGKILVCALPEIEDTARVVQIIDKEEEPKSIGINGARTPEQERDYYFTKGKHDVRVITGASYTTQRQEAARLYSETVKAMPDLMPIIGDLVFKYQDSPGAQAISERLKKTIDPKFLQDDKNQDPMVTQLNSQLQQVTMEAQQTIQQLQSELKSKQAEMQLKQKDQQLKAQSEGLKIEVERAKLELEAKKLELEQQKMYIDMQNTQRQQDLTNAPANQEATSEQFLLEEQELQQKAMMEQAEIEQRNSMLEAQHQAHLQDLQAKAIQTQAVIDALSGIQNQLGNLTASVQQPIKIQRDAQGNIIGAV
jgi:uncharacterized protein YgiM (DUF1202 family)